MDQEKWFTVGDGALYLGITDKSLRKYLKELRITPVPHTGDQRMKYYSQVQLNQVADAKGLVPGQKPPNIRSLALDLRNLRHELENLRRDLEELRKQMEADHAQLALPPLPANHAPSRTRPNVFRDFVARHTTERDVELLMEQARTTLGWRATQRPGWVETVSLVNQRQLLESWRGKAGMHQCPLSHCPCHRILPE